MATLAIVQCGARKIWRKHPNAGPTRAKDAYASGYFQNNRAYAERFGKRWLILSAKYGFLEPETRIRDYDVSFLDPRTHPIGIGKLRTQVRLKRLARYRDVVVLGGSAYVEIVRRAFTGTAVKIHQPFRGLRGIGFIQQAVKRAVLRGRMDLRRSWRSPSKHEDS